MSSNDNPFTLADIPEEYLIKPTDQPFLATPPRDASASEFHEWQRDQLYCSGCDAPEGMEHAPGCPVLRDKMAMQDEFNRKRDNMQRDIERMALNQRRIEDDYFREQGKANAEHRRNANPYEQITAGPVPGSIQKHPICEPVPVAVEPMPDWDFHMELTDHNDLSVKFMHQGVCCGEFVYLDDERRWTFRGAEFQSAMSFVETVLTMFAVELEKRYGK